MSIFRAMFPGRAAAYDVAKRWRVAFDRQPELATDIITLGRVLTLRPGLYENGIEVPEPIDPTRLAYEQGQRDMAVKLLALGGVTTHELSKLMERDNED